MSVMV